MDNPAQSTHLTARGWAGDVTVGQTWLDVTWRALRREVRSLDASLAAGEFVVDDVIDVIVSATLRVLRNPDGNIAEEGAIDDYRESWRKADATQDVYFTAAELRRLLPAHHNVGFAGSIKYCG